MSDLGQLLAEVQEQVDHLLVARNAVTGPDSLRSDVSLRNDLLFGLLNLSRATAEIAAAVSDHKDLPYEDPRDALRRIDRLEAVPGELADRLRPFARLSEEIDGRPSTTDYEPVIDALYELEPVQTFASFAAGLGLHAGSGGREPGHDRIAPGPAVDPDELVGDEFATGETGRDEDSVARTGGDASSTGVETDGG